MKEDYRSPSPGRVALFQSILEDAEICTFVRNDSTQQSLVTGVFTAILTLPDFWPTLCVMNDEDYPEAMTILTSVRDTAETEQPDWPCPQCAASVPGNFTACWRCESPRSPESAR